ncbi:MAG: hypothetical protein ABMA26_06635 [Limisphaerales bacterium]
MRKPLDAVRNVFPRQMVRWLGSLSLGACLLGGFASPVRAATPLFVNLSDVNNPSIDATAVVNFGTINATNSSFLFNNFLYQTINTLNLTNTIGGTFSGDLGFDFGFTTNTSRLFSDYFVNQGIIRGDTIQITATNVLNSGDLSAGELLLLQGNNVNLTRSVLTATLNNTLTSSTTGFRSVDTNGVVTYQNPSAVTDIYWGAGTGNVMTVSSAFGGLFLQSLNSISGGFRPPQSASPSHEVQSSGFGAFGGFPSISGTNFISYVRTNRQGTNINIQVVLVQPNAANTNLSVDVRFASLGGLGGGGGNLFPGITPIVRFSTFGSDITTGGLYTNNLYFLDYINSRTNSLLSDNTTASSSRPAGYELSRGSTYDFYFTPTFSFTTNFDIAGVSFFQPDFTDSVVTNNFYSAWQASVGNAANAPGSATYVPHLDDPTNSPGRIDITANDLDIRQARIKADNLVSIHATNLVSSDAVIIDAPFIQLFIANTNTTLTLTNFAATQVARPNGTLSFYSTTWTNLSTNAGIVFRYHVLMVDASQLSGITPVTLQEFNARGTNVIINNALNIGRVIQIDSPALTFSASSSLNLPLLTSTNLASTNFPNLNYFTNLGAISVPYQCALGADRATPIASFVNRGIFTANNITIRATDYESTGTNFTRSLVGGVNVGGGGPISITADSAKFDGGTGGAGLLSAGGSILLAGNDLKIRGHQLFTAGTLILSPTNSLTDTGSSGTNRINCALGFSLTVKPVSGDLLGTTIYTTAPFNRDVPHVWAGNNVGPVAAGYTNNAALGRLLLDTSNNAVSLNRLSFAGTGTNNALYVDYLELSGTVTNDLASHLFIETNMTLYFANANLPVQSLDGQLGGRLRWVKDYAGLNTGVDVRLPDGRTVKVNVAKLNSQVLDSDADGVVNASDLSPFDGIIMNSSVTFTNVPPLTAFVTWEAAAQTVYQVEVNTNLLAGTWQFLSNFTNSATTNRVVTFSDVVPTGAAERYFRVSYQP